MRNVKFKNHQCTNTSNRFGGDTLCPTGTVLNEKYFYIHVLSHSKFTEKLLGGITNFRVAYGNIFICCILVFAQSCRRKHRLEGVVEAYRSI